MWIDHHLKGDMSFAGFATISFNLDDLLSSVFVDHHFKVHVIHVNETFAFCHFFFHTQNFLSRFRIGHFFEIIHVHVTVRYFDCK